MNWYRFASLLVVTAGTWAWADGRISFRVMVFAFVLAACVLLLDISLRLDAPTQRPAQDPNETDKT